MLMRKVYSSNKDKEKVDNAFRLVESFNIDGVGKIIKKVLQKDRFKHL